VAGRYLHIERDEVGGDYSSLLLDVLHLIDHSEETAGAITNAALAVDGYTNPTGTGKQRYRYEDDIGGFGPWSEVTYNVTTSVAELVSTNGVGKNSLGLVSGTPPLTYIGTNGVGANMPVRMTVEAQSDYTQIELKNFVNGLVSCGFMDGTDNLNSGFVAPGAGTNNGWCIVLSTGYVAVHSVSNSVQQVLSSTGGVLNHATDTVEIRLKISTSEVEVWRVRGGIATQIGSTVPVADTLSDHYFYVSATTNNGCDVNAGADTYAMALSGGCAIYG
jgi:hypothetical protein